MRQYDPQQVVASFSWTGGTVDILEGAAADSFLTIEEDNPRFTRESDREGGATRVKNNNRGGVITVTLSASSPANASLTNIAIADDLGSNAVGEIVVKDLSGSEVTSAVGAFIESRPKPSYGSDRGTRVWRFQCERIDVAGGGHDVV